VRNESVLWSKARLVYNAAQKGTPRHESPLQATTRVADESGKPSASRDTLPCRAARDLNGDLTMYQPNFCAECGTHIERARWHVWTSRRFCRQCARRFRRSRIISTVLAGAGLFSLGLVCGRFQRAAPPPLIVERGGELPEAPLPSSASNDTAKSSDTGNERDETATTATQPETVYGPDGTATERPTDPNETVSICGARTQKGTPCRRRVRGTGRCWQHKGMPAIIPLEKLVVTGK
jgi:hypothetical protein